MLPFDTGNTTDPCSTSPCLNGGICESIGGRARCRCPTEFGGDFCSTRKTQVIVSLLSSWVKPSTTKPIIF